jgi:hypothetical protein
MKIRKSQKLTHPHSDIEQGDSAKSGFTMTGEADCPLLWLFRRKNSAGENLISPASFAAGERLRSDLTFSGMLPKTTMNWSAQAVDISRSSQGLNPAEAVIAARQRVDHAMRAVGPEFSSLLMDICGFGKGLEMIEQQRNWPQRSGKVAVQLALSCLARHYGLDDVAIGRAKAPMRRWASEDAQPKIKQL